jgi:hypothetical protein
MTGFGTFETPTSAEPGRTSIFNPYERRGLCGRAVLHFKALVLGTPDGGEYILPPVSLHPPAAQ